MSGVDRPDDTNGSGLHIETANDSDAPVARGYSGLFCWLVILWVGRWEDGWVGWLVSLWLGGLVGRLVGWLVGLWVRWLIA